MSKQWVETLTDLSAFILSNMLRLFTRYSALARDSGGLWKQFHINLACRYCKYKQDIIIVQIWPRHIMNNERCAVFRDTYNQSICLLEYYFRIHNFYFRILEKVSHRPIGKNYETDKTANFSGLTYYSGRYCIIVNNIEEVWILNFIVMLFLAKGQVVFWRLPHLPLPSHQKSKENVKVNLLQAVWSYKYWKEFRKSRNCV